MERTAAREIPETLRLARPGRSVAFGKQDVVAAGYPAALAAARESGFTPVQRLAGGRAAIFHEGTLVFGHAIPDPDPRPGIHERFTATAELIVDALARLGVDARVGEVAGEYCPGRYSVNAGGRRKLMGAGQRLISGGAHVGGVVVVDGAAAVNDALRAVYPPLGLDFDPDTTGAVAAEAPDGASVDAVAAAIVAEYGERFELRPAPLDAETLALARRLAPEHLPR